MSEIRSRVHIVDLIGRYVDLKRAGRSYKALCPFHDEKTPSFNVNPDRQVFHCFGCGAGGDVFGFLMRHENLTFPEAARTLARECGVEIPETSRERGQRGLAEQIFAANAAAWRLYVQALAAREGAAARAYLERRGLGLDEAGRFGIGYAPDRWDGVVRALEQAGIPASIGEKAGLLSARERGGHYDLLRGRLVFPIHDVRDRIVGFGGRALRDDQQPKYLNTPESPVFHKRRALYGFPAALEPIRRAERAVVCEGYFDRIALARADVGEALATCGTALTPDHARELRRRTRRVVLLFDGDDAGQRAMLRALEVLLPEGLRVRAVALPAGEDPDSLLAARGPEALRALVDGAPDAIEWAIRRATLAGCRSPEEKSDAVARVAPLVAAVPDPVARHEYGRRLAGAIGTDAGAVDEVIRRARPDEPTGAPADGEAMPRPRRRETVLERHLRTLVLTLIQHPTLAARHARERFAELVPGEPEVPGAWRELVLALVDAAGAAELGPGEPLDVFDFGSRLEDQAARHLLQEIAVGEDLLDDEASPARVVDDILAWFERRRRSAEHRELTRRLEDPAADAAALLAAKQRQLEERRAARALRESGDADAVSRI